MDRFARVSKALNPTAARRGISLASLLAGGKGWPLGRYLARCLPLEQRRAAAAGLLAGDAVDLSFEANGVRWTADVGTDMLCLELVTTGGYQAAEVAAVLAWLTEHRAGHSVLIDVGANIGTTTVPFAMSGYRTVSIEPVPNTFRLLETNVRQNGLSDQVTCVQTAITNDGATAEMWLTAASGVSEIAGTGEPGFHAQSGHFVPRERIEVPAARLGDVLAAHGINAKDVAIVWSDTQGCEADVIETGTPLWKEGVPLYVEIWPVGLAAQGSVEQFVDLARGHFTGFIPKCDLVSGRHAPKPISGFEQWIGSVDDFSDALMIP